MQCLEVSCAVQLIYTSLGAKGLRVSWHVAKYTSNMSTVHIMIAPTWCMAPYTSNMSTVPNLEHRENLVPRLKAQLL